jgi:hypothetical protein
MSILQFTNEKISKLNTKYFNNQEKQSLNQFMLTPSESLIINNKLPPVFKLVLDNNDDIKIEQTTKELSIKEEEAIPKLKQKRRLKSKKKISEFKEFFKNIQKEKMTLVQKCEKCLDRILSEKCSNKFYNPLYNYKIPSLFSIKQNLKNNKYNKASEFFLDLRNIWNYYFEKYPSESIIYKNCCLMSKLTEELDNQFDKIDKDEIYRYILNKEISYNFNFKNNKINGIEKKMSVGEKNALGFAIRSLNKDQLKGFVKLLKKLNLKENQNGEKKFIEFNIDKLPNDILKNLKLYVEECGINFKNIYQYNRIYKGNNNNNNNIIKNLKSKISEIEEPKKNLQKKNQTNNENTIKYENKKLFDKNSINTKVNSNNSNSIEKKNESKNQNINVYPDIEKLLSSSEQDSEIFSDFEI